MRGAVFALLAMAGATALLLAAGAEAAPGSCPTGPMRVVPSGLNVRALPGGPVIDRLEHGTIVVVKGCEGAWRQLGPGRWVQGDHLAAPHAAPSALDSARLVRVRDEAIDIIGYVAGNTYGHASHRDVLPYVGEGGEYYDTWMTLMAPGSDPELQAALNVARYNEAEERGRAAPYDPQDLESRIRRLLQLIEEMGAVLDAARR